MARIPSQTQVRAWRAMALAHQGILEVLEEELWEARQLQFAWYDVLVTLRLAGGSLRMHELAEMTLLSRSATTRLIDKIEEAGLVERRVCPTDRRGMEVSLTPDGRRVQERAAPVVLRGLQQHFGRHLDEDQAELMASAFEQVLRGEGRSVPGPAMPAPRAVSPAAARS